MLSNPLIFTLFVGFETLWVTSIEIESIKGYQQ